jgi:hypothetical protein
MLRMMGGKPDPDPGSHEHHAHSGQMSAASPDGPPPGRG